MSKTLYLSGEGHAAFDALFELRADGSLRIAIDNRVHADDDDGCTAARVFSAGEIMKLRAFLDGRS